MGIQNVAHLGHILKGTIQNVVQKGHILKASIQELSQKVQILGLKKINLFKKINPFKNINKLIWASPHIELVIKFLGCTQINQS